MVMGSASPESFREGPRCLGHRESRDRCRPATGVALSFPVCPSYRISRSTSRRSNAGWLGSRSPKLRLKTPFLLRTVDPPLDELVGQARSPVRRLGKRIVFGMDDDLFLVLHLMIAGRLHWKPRGAQAGRATDLAAFDFPNGTLMLTEAGTKRRASLHVVRGRGGACRARSRRHRGARRDARRIRRARSRSENHTLKRALTDPRLFSGIGNAYSDEILHRARLSPVRLTKTPDRRGDRDAASTRRAPMLVEWTERLRAEARREVPREGHRVPPGDGGARQVRAAVPRLRRAGAAHSLRRQRDQLLRALPDGGKLLADRALSRLLKKDWPKSIDEAM